jgi:hypothetical protein
MLNVFVLLITFLIHNPLDNTFNGNVEAVPFQTQSDCQKALDDFENLVRDNKNKNLFAVKAQCVDAGMEVVGGISAQNTPQ